MFCNRKSITANGGERRGGRRYGNGDGITEEGLTHCTAAGIAQSVERLTAERKVAGSIPGAGPILRVLK